MFVRMLLLALAYYLAGRLGLLMAIPPGYAATFWPAAGVGLAGVLILGYSAWPGIAVASFLINVGVSFDNSSRSAEVMSIVLPVCIGFGASLQAVVGTYLIRRFVGFPNPLNREQDIATLLVLGGPGASLINATFGVTLLWLCDRIQASEYAFNWWVWWIGDTIGVFLVAPLVLVWTTWTQADWPRRPVTVTLPMAVLISLVVGVFFWTQSREQERLYAAFNAQTESLARALEGRLDRIQEAVYGMRSFRVGLSPTDDRRRFTTIADATLQRRHAILSLIWAPRVPNAERAKFEAMHQSDTNPAWEIRERNAEDIIRAAHRPEYYPVLFRQPPPDAEGVFGFDVAFEADRRQALLCAGETAEPIASPPFLGPKKRFGDEKFMLVFLAIYRTVALPESPEERRRSVIGYVVAPVQVSRLVEMAWHDIRSDGIDFWLYDDTARETRLALFRKDAQGAMDAPPLEEKAGMLRYERSIAIKGIGRRFTLRFVQTPEYLAANRSMQPWSVLAGGMLFTGLLGSVLLGATGRTSLVTSLVHERTAELAKANEAMTEEITERKRIEEHLRQSEEHIRLLIEGTTDYAIYMIDPRGNILTWNAAAERIKGYSGSEIIGRSFTRFFTEEDIRQGKPERMLAEAEKTGRLEDEGWRVRKDGSRFWANGIITALRDPYGRLRGFLKITRDVTERQQADEALRASEARFRALTQSMNDAVISTDADGRIVFWNKNAEVVFGYTEPEVLGQSFEMLVPADQTAFTGESAWIGRIVELVGRRKDGSEFPLELSLAAWQTPEGKFFTGVVRDISERKRIQKEFDENLRFIEHVAGMMPNILFVYDLEQQRNIYVNRRIESILGYSTVNAMQSDSGIFDESAHPDDLAKLEWAHERYQTADDNAVVEIEYRMRHANGSWRWLHSRNMVFKRDAEGNAQQIIGTIQDITEKKQLELEVLEIAAREQRRIGQELHDGSGQELTGLCMLADNLADALRDQAPTEGGLSRRIAQGLREALGHVRALSRGLVPVEVDAEGLMAALTELTTRIGDTHRIRCVFECYEPVPIEDNFTATQLYRIAQEAITNALKHGQARNIRVSLEARGYYVTLKIADDGIGVKEGDPVNAGMGLQIMRYRAGQIGAQFLIRRGPSGGTVVTCTFFRGPIHD